MKQTNFKFLSTLVPIGIVLTIAALMYLPLGLTALLKISNLDLSVTPSGMAMKLSFCIYTCAIPYVVALFKLKKICKLMNSENPFDIKISKEFSGIALCAFLEAPFFIAATLITVFAFNLYLYALTLFPVVIVTFIAITAGFLFKVISSVFQKAAEIKEDIDLTF